MRFEVISKVIWRSPWPQKATRMATTVNMHIDIGVKKVAAFKSKVTFIVPLLASLKGHCPLVRIIIVEKFGLSLGMVNCT